jgi:hypothetical protein
MELVESYKNNAVQEEKEKKSTVGPPQGRYTAVRPGLAKGQSPLVTLATKHTHKSKPN